MLAANELLGDYEEDRTNSFRLTLNRDGKEFEVTVAPFVIPP